MTELSKNSARVVVLGYEQEARECTVRLRIINDPDLARGVASHAEPSNQGQRD
jgi:hypothetical protein